MTIISRIVQKVGCCGSAVIAEEPVLATRLRTKAPQRLADVACASPLGDLAAAAGTNSLAVIKALEDEGVSGCLAEERFPESLKPQSSDGQQVWLPADSRSTTPSRLGGFFSDSQVDGSECSTFSRSRSQSTIEDSCCNTTTTSGSKGTRPIVHSELIDQDLQALRELPRPIGKPTVSKILEVESISSIYESLTSHLETGALNEFMLEQGCQDMAITQEWSMEENCQQVYYYSVPLPADVPDLLRRALALPEMLSGCTVNHICFDDDRLVLSQRSHSEGILYSDRMRVQSVHVFSQLPTGQVEWSQWSEVAWLQPLPWTHGLLVKAIQQKAADEAKICAPVFAVALQKASQR